MESLTHGLLDFLIFKITYSIVVMVENGGGGGAIASPIAGDIVEYYINSSKSLAEN